MKIGSIFILDNNLCNLDETIIYGHNRMNKIMFSELSKYMKNDFFYSHQNVNIYTPKANYLAKVFSAYSINEKLEEQNTKNLSFVEKIKYYKNKSEYKVNDIKQVDKIVKLSTCSYLNTRKLPTEDRYYIIASIEKVK